MSRAWRRMSVSARPTDAAPISTAGTRVRRECPMKRAVLAVFLQHRLRTNTPNSHAAAEMKRIAHEVLAWADFHDATAEVADVVDSCLQRKIVRACDVRIAMPNRDAHGRLGMKIILGVFAICLVGANATDGEC